MMRSMGRVTDIAVAPTPTVPQFPAKYLAAATWVKAAGGNPNCDNKYEREAYEVAPETNGQLRCV